MDVTTEQSQLDRDRTLLPPLNQQFAVAQDAAVPSELVRDRPDIRAAEANLHAASANVEGLPHG
jgi:outer membrane protein TolC